MTLIDLIKDAKLDVLFMSGTGLGAVLLTIIALAFISRAKLNSEMWKALFSLPLWWRKGRR